MLRKIDLWYRTSEKTITLIYEEENENHYQCYVKEYDREMIKDWAKLYNSALDYFDAEFDDEVARGLEKLCKKIGEEIKEYDV